MKVFVKMLQGQECTLDVEPETSVAQLKDSVFKCLNVPVTEQKLILLGKPLSSDDKAIKEYGVKEGSKLNLIRRPCDVPTTASQSENPSVLREAMMTFLLKHLPPADAMKVLDVFMKDFYRSVENLSLDDLERIAKLRLQEEKEAAESAQ